MSPTVRIRRARPPRVSWATAACIGGALWLAPILSAAQAPNDGVYVQAQSPSRRDGASTSLPVAAREQGLTQRRVEPRAALLYSTSNDNTLYQIHLSLRTELCTGVVLVIDRETFAASGITQAASGECEVDFVVGRAVATRSASVLGVRRLDRTPLGGAIAAHFALATTRPRPVGRIQVDFVLENAVDGSAIQFQVGGRQRGSRDNRFDFRVWRDGREVSPINTPDFGGPTGFLSLGPGERWSTTAFVDEWANVQEPGHYRVECAFTTVLAPSGASLTDPRDRHRHWDRRFEGVVEFDVTARSASAEI